MVWIATTTFKKGGTEVQKISAINADLQDALPLRYYREATVVGIRLQDVGYSYIHTG
jgi:hypothetical protein